MQSIPLQSIKQVLNPRQWWTIGIVLIGLLLFTLVSAPNSPQNIGSTYSRSPEGYGAWYAYMEKNGVKIDRLRQPIDNIFQSSNSTTGSNTTIIQILADGDKQANSRNPIWFEKGNQLILIGPKQTPMGSPAITQANFSSQPISPNHGPITIDTSQRFKIAINKALDDNVLDNAPSRSILKDDYGTIVLETKIGLGSILYVLPQFLAANAYQGTNNFAYLKSLVKNDRVVVDEYIHGYRDVKAAKEERKADMVDFLLRTPLVLIILQIGIVISVLIYSKNWRFGSIRTIFSPPINNSRAYIQALASILQKANSTDFVTETISKAELSKLQRALGLGNSPQDPEKLIKIWTQQTGQSSQNLENIFYDLRRQQKLSEAELIQWLALLQTISTKV